MSNPPFASDRKDGNSFSCFISHEIGRLWLAAILYGLFVYACMPAGVIALDDDFGYLRSVVLTLQHGRPWTDDWLEPWAASFSSLSALLYLITRNFYCATFGLLSVLAAVSFGFSALLLRKRNLPFSKYAVLAVIGLTFPTIFWKTIQYTGMALYIPCLLGALWACETRRWWFFLIVWSLGLATRQSAIIWAMLPLTVAVRSCWRERWLPVSREFWSPILTTTAGLALFAGLSTGMNKTHAQTVLTDHVFQSATLPNVMSHSIVGLAIYISMAGIGLLILNLATATEAGNLRSPTTLAYIGLAGAVLCSLNLRTLMSWEHQAIAGPVGWIYLKYLVIIGAVGWMFRGGRLRIDMLLAAGLGIALLTFRSSVWDYYYFDVAAFGLFGVFTTPKTANENSPSLQGWRFTFRTMAVVFVVVNGLLVLDFKAYLDRSYAITKASELALRKGLLTPPELSFAPFGFAAWHLYPYYILHDGKVSPNIAGFDCYQRRGAVEVGQGYSRLLHILPRFRHEPPSDRHNLITSIESRYLWVFRSEYFLLRFKSESDASADIPLPSNFISAPFPLNEVEWHQAITQSIGRQ